MHVEIQFVTFDSDSLDGIDGDYKPLLLDNVFTQPGRVERDVSAALESAKERVRGRRV